MPLTDFATSDKPLNCSAAAAKSLQLCLTLCDPIAGSPPGSPIPGILQARTLEWVAISFSNAWKWKVKVKLFSHVHLFATPWTAAHQAPLSMGFSRQEYWSGVPLPSLLNCSSLAGKPRRVWVSVSSRALSVHKNLWHFMNFYQIRTSICCTFKDVLCTSVSTETILLMIKNLEEILFTHKIYETYDYQYIFYIYQPH